MANHQMWRSLFITIFSVLLSSCASTSSQQAETSPNPDLPLFHGHAPYSAAFNESKYQSMLPAEIHMGHEKVILVNPKLYAWGAYDEDGHLVRGGIANAGAGFCKDEGHPCRTTSGTFHLYSLGDVNCASHIYPIPKGGALMPYCMFFHNGQSFHGTPDPMLVDANISHGCVHMRIPDAEWLRYNFAGVGTKVVIMAY
jgi:hypothetical protein